MGKVFDKEKIEKDYLAGKTYKEIEKKHKITHNQLLYLIRSNKWKRKNNRSKVQKGNKNAKGNKGGHAPEKNKNAVTTGEYESIYAEFYSEEEKEIAKKIKIDDIKESLLEQYELLVIRECRMLERIRNLTKDKKDLTIHSITRNKSSTTEYGGVVTESSSTYAESTNEKVQRIEEALTRVQEAKRRCIDSLHKIDIDNNKFELELLRFEREVAADEGPNENNAQDDGLLEALNIKAKEVWSDDK